MFLLRLVIYGFELVLLTEAWLVDVSNFHLSWQVILHHAPTHDNLLRRSFFRDAGALQVLMGHSELRHELAGALKLTVP